MLYDISNPGNILFEKGNEYSQATLFSEHEIKTRLYYAGALPFCLMRGCLESLEGIIDGTIALATGGAFNNAEKLKNFNERAIRSLNPSRHLLTRPYACVVKLLNPNAKIPIDILKSNKDYDETKASSLNTLRYSPNIFDRHVKVRVKIMWDTILQTIKDLSILVFGLMAASLSLLPMLGRSDYLNDVALRNIETPLIQNLFHNFLLLINPWAIDHNLSSYSY